MSWDVSVESPSGPMGTRDEVRAKISAALPGVDWGDPTMGFLERDGCSFEFMLLGDDDDDVDEDDDADVADDEDDDSAGVAAAPAGGPISGFVVSVRGQGEPMPTLVKLCKAHGWTLADADDGEEIDLGAKSAPGWQDFKGFRDGIADKLGGGKPGFFSRLFGKKS